MRFKLKLFVWFLSAIALFWLSVHVFELGQCPLDNFSPQSSINQASHETAQESIYGVVANKYDGRLTSADYDKIENDNYGNSSRKFYLGRRRRSRRTFIYNRFLPLVSVYQLMNLS